MFTLDEIKKISEENNIDFNKYDLAQFIMGLECESEDHPELIDGDDYSTIATIVSDHLDECDDYYTELEEMEEDIEEDKWEEDAENESVKNLSEKMSKKMNKNNGE